MIHRPPFAGWAGPLLDPAVAAYAANYDIGGAAAAAINAFLSGIRGQGVDPAFFWVGGTDYNLPDQTAAVIGDQGSQFSAGTDITAGSNYAYFNNGDSLVFNNPAAIKSSALQRFFALAIVSNIDTSAIVGNIFSAKNSNTDKGPFLVYAGTTEQTSFQTSVSASGSTVNQFRAAGLRIGAGYRLFCAVWDGPSAFHWMDGMLYHLNPGVLGDTIYNGGDTFRIGATENANMNWMRCKARIHAVVLGTFNEDVVGFETGARLIDTAFSSGFMADNSPLPLLVSVGDSTSSDAYGWVQYIRDMDEATNVIGGWREGCANTQLAVSGYSLADLVALTDTRIIPSLKQRGFATPTMVYGVEVFESIAAAALDLADDDEWYAYTEDWLQGIEAATGCNIVLCSYIKGNNDGTGGGANADDPFPTNLHCMARHH